MQNHKLNLSVGLFLFLGISALVYLSFTLSDFKLSAQDNYLLNARFNSASGLRPGAFVEVGGVVVGRVAEIAVDYNTYEALVSLSLDKRIKLQEDAIASIRTAGIIGDKFVKISAGGSDVILEEGDEIIETESSINLEELISKYIFEGGK